MLNTKTSECSSWVESLLDLLHRQRAMVLELAALADSQAELIAHHSTDGLLDVLAKRQILIDEFNACQGPMAQLTHRLDERLADVPSGQRDQIKSLIGVIGEKLAHVMKLDERDQHSLRGSRDVVKQELATLGTAKQARSAYQPSATASTNRYADQRG
jgi:hypothetical protein